MTMSIFILSFQRSRLNLKFSTCSIILESGAALIKKDFIKGQEVKMADDKGSTMVGYFWKGQASVGEGMSSSWV